MPSRTPSPVGSLGRLCMGTTGIWDEIIVMIMMQWFLLHVRAGGGNGKNGVNSPCAEGPVGAPHTRGRRSGAWVSWAWLRPLAAGVDGGSDVSIKTMKGE